VSEPHFFLHCLYLLVGDIVRRHITTETLSNIAPDYEHDLDLANRDEIESVNSLLMNAEGIDNFSICQWPHKSRHWWPSCACSLEGRWASSCSLKNKFSCLGTAFAWAGLGEPSAGSPRMGTISWPSVGFLHGHVHPTWAARSRDILMHPSQFHYAKWCDGEYASRNNTDSIRDVLSVAPCFATTSRRWVVWVTCAGWLAHPCCPRMS
jgi:hypothetical protein